MDMKIVFSVVVRSNLKDWCGVWLTVYYMESILNVMRWMWLICERKLRGPEMPLY